MREENIKIEDFWEAVTICYIQFETTWVNKETIRKVEKCIVVPADYSKEQIEQTVSSCFSNVRKITHIDFWEDGMLLKNNCFEGVHK